MLFKLHEISEGKFEQKKIQNMIQNAFALPLMMVMLMIMVKMPVGQITFESESKSCLNFLWKMTAWANLGEKNAIQGK